MKIILYEKKRDAEVTEFKPASNERLAWLINFIANLESDKDAAKIRLDALLNGEMINTDLNSYILKNHEKQILYTGINVMIRNDLKAGEKYGDTVLTEDMLKYIGKETSVLFCDSEKDIYSLNIGDDHLFWDREMLEELPCF